jgi:RecB family exonuclease
MEDYRKLGFLMLKSFYEECKTGVRVKYLEHKFRLKFGPYLFTGEIDRADETPDGLVVIDYKTGKAPEKMGEVNKEQLLIYQMAAQESLGEKVAKLEYWYLRNGLDKHDFLGTEKELAAVKEKYIKTIEQMVRCIKDNDFYNHDLLHAKHQTCKYRDLEKGEQEYLTLAAQSAKKSKTKSVN